LRKSTGSMKARVFQFKRYSVHDGPGIRTTVFLKGCPLSCHWCHNPEGILSVPQMVFMASRCIGCGNCASVCPSGAIDPKDPSRICMERCDLCGICVEGCPAAAREIAGMDATPTEVMDLVERDIPFYGTSGGGVTFSGGEPLLQADFLEEILVECRDRGIHTAVDTSCCAPEEVFMRVSRLADLMLCDIKLVDDGEMLHYTGGDASRVLDNIRLLAGSGSAFILRMPVIPGITDTERNLQLVAEFLLGLPLMPDLQLLPYHSSWRDKYSRLGLPPPEGPDPDEGLGIIRALDFLREAGVLTARGN